VNALEKIFGLGADFIESLIMKRLAEKIELDSKWRFPKELKLVEYVNVAKQNFLKERDSDKIEMETVQCNQLENES
jgi:hypothetical protein